MPVWDLATRENWKLILTESRVAERKPNNPDPARYEYLYLAIPPIFATPSSHILLIGTYSRTAEPHWFLGARVTQYLYVSPSMNSNLISGVQTSEIKRVGLNRLTLVEFPNYNISPYAIQLEIPYWLEDIYVEVWEYEGYYLDKNEQFEEIILRLDSIEEQLNKSAGQ